MTTPLAATAPPPRPAPRRRHLALKISVILLILAAVIISAWSWIAVTYKYSTGMYTGYVHRLTKSGWLCKTWEGEMNILPVPGTPMQQFQFTLHSDSLASIIQNASGKQVSLTYSRHVAIPSRCFGETPFYVDAVRIVP